MNNFLATNKAMAQKLTDFIQERDMFAPGFVIGTGRKTSRKDMIQALILFESFINAKSEDEKKTRYKHYQEFVEEIHKPEYNCLFPEPNPGFKGFKRRKEDNNG